MLRAIRDANVPKFLQDDLKLFNGIVSDLFPTTEDVVVDYGDMEKSIREKAMEKGLEDVEGECVTVWEGDVRVCVGVSIPPYHRCGNTKLVKWSLQEKKIFGRPFLQ